MKTSYFLAISALSVAGAIAAVMPETKSGASLKKVVCYYGSWAVYRPDDGKFEPENIDPFMCTHIIYGFVGLGFDNRMRLLDAYLDVCKDWGRCRINIDNIDEFHGKWKDETFCAMERFTGLKKKNPKLKTMLAIGGWNEGSEKYSKMVANAESRKTFIKSVVDFLPTQGFDGFDLDWEYPAHRGGVPEDKNNYDLLLAEMRAEFDKHGYLLSAAVSAGEDTIKNAYNVPSMAKYLDFVNVMAYDFHGAWDFHKYTHHNAPLFEHPLDASHNNSALNIMSYKSLIRRIQEDMNRVKQGNTLGFLVDKLVVEVLNKYDLIPQDHAVKTWHQLGLPKEKIIMGLASYGRGFIVNSVSDKNIYAPANQGIEAGPVTRERGYWGYNEICTQLKAGGWDIVRDKYIQAPIATRNDQWIGFDDPESIGVKTAYARDNDLGGVMVWSLETDDFHGKCGTETFPLIKTMHRVLIGELPAPPSTPPSPSKPDSTPSGTATSGNAGAGTPSGAGVSGDTTPVQVPATPAKPPGPSPVTPPAGEVCKHEGHNRDPADCNIFYHCKFDGDKWTATRFQCGDGTAFNTAQNSCDFPWNVPGCL